jgi:hypothetical protein
MIRTKLDPQICYTVRWKLRSEVFSSLEAARNWSIRHPGSRIFQIHRGVRTEVPVSV